MFNKSNHPLKPLSSAKHAHAARSRLLEHAARGIHVVRSKIARTSPRNRQARASDAANQASAAPAAPAAPAGASTRLTPGFLLALMSGGRSQRGRAPTRRGGEMLIRREQPPSQNALSQYDFRHPWRPHCALRRCWVDSGLTSLVGPLRSQSSVLYRLGWSVSAWGSIDPVPHFS